jgi:hypothetical protein
VKGRWWDFFRFADDPDMVDPTELVDAKVVTFAELDHLAAEHPTARRGNHTFAGAGEGRGGAGPVAYVVLDDGVALVAPGLHNATHGGYVVPGGSRRPRLTTGDERRADEAAQADHSRQLRAGEEAVREGDRLFARAVERRRDGAA